MNPPERRLHDSSPAGWYLREELRTGHGAVQETGATPSGTAIRLVLVVLAALSLRLPGMRWGYGLPGFADRFVALHPDETFFVEVARNLEEGKPFRRSYVLGLGQALRLVLAWGRSRGILISGGDLVTAGRILSLGSGLLAVLLTYWLGRALSGDAWTALAAATLIALNSLCAVYSHLCTADMAYTFLLYLFAGLAWSGIEKRRPQRLVSAAVVAGTAMAVKFGPVLLPSVLLLGRGFPRRRLGGGLVCLAVCAAMFVAVQGGAFNAESARAILRSFLHDNLGGFKHARWQNPVVYAMELVRSGGLPAAALTAAGALALLRGRRLRSPAILIAFLPLGLHAAGILALNLPFPRHILPLLPAAALCAAWRISRMGEPAKVLVLCAIWSAALALSDAYAFVYDARKEILRTLREFVPVGTPVAVDPGFRVPLERLYPRSRVEDAALLVLHESWTFRFLPSELHPLGIPDRDELYHVGPADLRMYRSIQCRLREGTLKGVYRAGPIAVLPEALLYRRLWGNFFKFCGECRLLAEVDAGAVGGGGQRP